MLTTPVNNDEQTNCQEAEGISRVQCAETYTLNNLLFIRTAITIEKTLYKSTIRDALSIIFWNI